MPDSAKRRLERLFDDAYELSRLPGHVFGFILIAGPKGTRVRDDNTWLEIGRCNTVPGDMFPMWLRDFWVDPDPDQTRCVWWWGDPRGIDRFKHWVERMSLLLWEDSTLVGDITDDSGLFGTLCALCQFARKQPELADLIRDRVAQVSDSSLRRSGDHPDERIPKNKVYMLHVIPEGGYFAHVVAGKLLGRLPKGPRLIVDRETNMATLDGLTYPLNREYILILDVLIKANGNTVSRRSMARKEKELQAWGDDLDHVMKERLARDCPPLRKVIESVPKVGYRIAKDYLE